jgi:hypothetical protein
MRQKALEKSRAFVVIGDIERLRPIYGSTMTPPLLHDLIRLVARDWDVRVPRLRLAVGVIRRLPAALTRANFETLGFLCADRYPTLGALELAMKSNIIQPPRAEEMILRWADALASTRFSIEEAIK